MCLSVYLKASDIEDGFLSACWLVRILSQVFPAGWDNAPMETTPVSIMKDEYVKLGLQLLDVLSPFAWPLTALIVIFMFRDPIKKRMDRLVKLTTQGVEFDLSEAQQSEKLSKPTSDLAATKLKNFPEFEVLHELEERLNDELKLINEEFREKLLVKHLAICRLDFSCAEIFSSIYRSQINALLILADMKSVKSDQVFEYFNNHVLPLHSQEHPDYSCDAWLHFMIRRNLIKYEGGLFAITSTGRYFIDFMNKYNLRAHNNL